MNTKILAVLGLILLSTTVACSASPTSDDRVGTSAAGQTESDGDTGESDGEGAEDEEPTLEPPAEDGDVDGDHADGDHDGEEDPSAASWRCWAECERRNIVNCRCGVGP